MTFSGWVNSQMQHFLQTRICLLQHIKQASYQATIWKGATIPIIDMPSPTDHGWKIDEEGNIDVVWMTKKCASSVLLNQLLKRQTTSVMKCASVSVAQFS